MSDDASNKVQENEASTARRREYFALVNFRQYSWYFFALGIYLFCVAIGFVIAYFVLRVVIYYQVHPQ